MRRYHLLILPLILLAGCATTEDGSTWSCSAKGMVSGRYTGGTSAYIHLAGFSAGGQYPVTVSDGVATGKTKNGTPFTCTRQP